MPVLRWIDGQECPSYDKGIEGTRVMLSLPIDSLIPGINRALAQQGAVVLRAPTGAGKTTRVPPGVLAAGLAGEGKVLVLQPRRVAARATAARMADENGWPMGQRVGYHVRFERRSGPATRIEVITEGILLQRLRRDPFLQEAGVVVFDEFHERNLNSDLALGMVRQIQQTVRPELKIVVMSATLEMEPLVGYLGGCPALACEVRRYPVEVSYSDPRERQPMAEAAAEGVLQVLDARAGDVLVFLPGLREIRQTRRLLSDVAARRGVALLELYGDLPAREQDAVLGPCPTRKVILATNVAETSLTIEGVGAVVDSGWARQQRFDPRVGLDRLQLLPISQAAADQRAGRAGRTGPGLCLRLWHRGAHAARPLQEEPEIRRVDLAAAVLQLLCWIEPDVAGFPWFEPPRPESLARAMTLLRRLDAADDAGVTRLGRRLAGFPVHPRLARLLVEGSRRGCARRAALAAALLSERSVFARPSGPQTARRAAPAASPSDLLDRVQALEQFAASGRVLSPCGRIQPGAAHFVFRARDQLLRQMRRSSGAETEAAGPLSDVRGPLSQAGDDAGLLRSLLAAFPDRLARRRQPGSRQGLMVGGRGVRLADESAVLESPLFVCVEIDRGTSESLVRCASAVQRQWLPARHLSVQTEVFFDPATERVAARRRVLWEDLVLQESPTGSAEPAETSRVLAEAARQHWPRLVAGVDPAAMRFVTRVRCLRQWLPELDLPPLPDADLQDLLPLLADGCKSFAQLKQAPWLATIQRLLRFDQRQTLEREAPERLPVPGGRQVPIVYEEGRPPVMAVRIQEVFDWAETPRIARHRVPVLLHLLAPNMRPQQITDDLRSFWENTYPEVRKQLRGRYPKHDWPERPG